MDVPNPSAAILSWAKAQSPWRQDALRRILTKPFTQADEDECLELLKAEHGLVQSKLKPLPLVDTHLPIKSETATSLRLLSLDDIANVNRLASDASLSLAPEGITVIYGDNGSGKSGYVRILKKACRARDEEPILPDVFTAKKTKNAPASAQFTVIEGDAQPTSLKWVDDGVFASDLLGRIAIFDSRCASVHVDGENRLEVIPHNLDCFEKLAYASDQLRARLKQECEALEGQLAGNLPTAPQGTEANQFLQNLEKKTEAELAKLLELKEKEIERLAELSNILKDPAAEALRCERLVKAFREFADSLATATDRLSDEKLVKIATLRADAMLHREQSDASAAAAFAKEPLPGVGDPLWRTLFDAAKAYSERTAYPGTAFPKVDDDARCVLCQQTVDEETKERFGRFANFVTGAMNAKAAASEKARDGALGEISPDKLPIQELGNEARDYLIANHIGLEAETTAYRDALITARTAALSDKPSQSLPRSPNGELRKVIAGLEAATIEARSFAKAGGDAAALRQEHAELSGRKIIRDNSDELKRRIQIYGKIAKIDQAMKGCATKDISDQGTKLLKAHVTEALALALVDEQKALGLDSIPLALTDRTTKAVVQHRLRLNGSTLAADTSAVLSEGEHRAVALAAFLSELKVYPGKDAITIDDPVSSLDHVRRSKVAERLVREARDRQVIVFTHDLVFLSEVRYFAARNQTPLRVLGIRRGPTGFGSRDPDNEPWLTKSLSGRRGWLEEQLARLKKLHKDASGDYESQLRFFYDRLRESWERLVEEKLFAQVIGRFQPQVQTQRLREAVIDDDVFSQVHFGMTAVSSYTGHDRAEGKGGALADPSECEKHLKDLLDCIDQTEKKAKVVAKTREAKLKAPVG